MKRRVKKAWEPIRRRNPSPLPDLASSAMTEAGEQFCLEEGIRIRDRLFKAARFEGKVSHSLIRGAIARWKVLMGLGGLPTVRGLCVTRQISNWPSVSSCVEPEDVYEATKFNGVRRKTHGLFDLANVGRWGDMPACIAAITCLNRLSVDVARGSEVGWAVTYVRCVPHLAAFAVGAATVPAKKLYDLHMPLLEAFEAGCLLIWQTASEIRYMERPYVFKLDTQNRLHCDSGPALVWGDGIAYHYWRGSHVHAGVIQVPAHKITVEMVDAEQNVENRRVLLERMGEDRYIEESEMEPIDHHDKFGTLFVKRFWIGRPIARLRVINRSPEPDGTYRVYWLPINPDLYHGDAGILAHAAAASTWRTKPGGGELFFRDWRDYNPYIET